MKEVISVYVLKVGLVKNVRNASPVILEKIANHATCVNGECDDGVSGLGFCWCDENWLGLDCSGPRFISVMITV